MATNASETSARAIARDERREYVQGLAQIGAVPVVGADQRNTFLPQNMAEAMRLSELMSASSFVPAAFRGKPGDCLAIVMQASRWGMDPFAVALKTYFVKDGAPPAFEAQLVNAVVNSSGVLSGRLRVEMTGNGDGLRCTVTGYLKADPDTPMVKTQSIARLTTKNSPLWKSDPDQQLAYYTTRAWARLYAPEVLLGVYTPDELEVDPERARNVTPMPRRQIDAPASDFDGAGHEPADPITGEVLDRSGASEQPARVYDMTVDDAENHEARIGELIEKAATTEELQTIVAGIPADLPDDNHSRLLTLARTRHRDLTA